MSAPWSKKWPGPLPDDAVNDDLPGEADVDHGEAESEWAVEEEEPEDDLFDDDGDGQSLMQTLAVSRTCSSPPTALTMAFVIQTLLNAMADLTHEAAMTVAQRLLARLDLFDADHLCLTLLRQTLEPLVSTPTTPMPDSSLVLPRELAAFLDKWWGILQRHLPEERPNVVTGDPRTLMPPASAPVCHAGTETEGLAADHVLDVLVTASSSVDQVSSKMTRLAIPEDEAVALTLVAAVQSATSSSRLIPCEDPGLPRVGRPLPRGVAPGHAGEDALCHDQPSPPDAPLPVCASELSAPSFSASAESVKPTLLLDLSSSAPWEPTLPPRVSEAG